MNKFYNCLLMSMKMRLVTVHRVKCGHLTHSKKTLYGDIINAILPIRFKFDRTSQYETKLIYNLLHIFSIFSKGYICATALYFIIKFGYIVYTDVSGYFKYKLKSYRVIHYHIACHKIIKVSKGNKYRGQKLHLNTKKGIYIYIYIYIYKTQFCRIKIKYDI